MTVAHSGAHEPPGDLQVQHIHGERDALLSPGGPLGGLSADVIVDTRALYRAACDRLAIAPEDCVYVGNGDGEELAGATTFGMRPVLFTAPR